MVRDLFVGELWALMKIKALFLALAESEVAVHGVAGSEAKLKRHKLRVDYLKSTLTKLLVVSKNLGSVSRI